MEDDNQSNVSDQKPKKKINFSNATFNVLIIIGVFLLGIAIGSNKIKLGPDAVFRQSVQTSELGEIDYQGIDELYKSLTESYDGQLDAQEIEDGLKSGLVSATGDPYTEYFNEEGAKEFNEQLSGSFEGIGAELGKEGDFVVIISPIEGFPAQKVGLKAGDIITKIDGEEAYDITITDAVKKIRGQKGTNVKLEVIRDGSPLEFEITRATINLPSVKTEVVDGNIGVIKISRFGEDTVSLVRKSANDLKSKNVNGIILDMRSNPGGLLDASVGVASIWLEKGDVVLDEKRNGETIKTFEATGSPILSGVPTVVLINEGSASASEIVAGALKDNDAVIGLVGSRSFGKGSVQEVKNLKDGGLLKVTIARWFTPGGNNIDQEGIKPDFQIELTDKDIEAKKDPQQDKAVELIKQN